MFISLRLFGFVYASCPEVAGYTYPLFNLSIDLLEYTLSDFRTA